MSKFVNFPQSHLIGDVLNFPYHEWLIYALSLQAKFKWVIDDTPNFFHSQHQLNYMGGNFGFQSRLKRLNGILFSEYYKKLIILYKI